MVPLPPELPCPLPSKHSHWTGVFTFGPLHKSYMLKEPKCNLNSINCCFNWNGALANNYNHLLTIHDQQKPKKFEAFVEFLVLIKISFHIVEVQNLSNLDNYLNALWNVHPEFSLALDYLDAKLVLKHPTTQHLPFQ